MKILKILFALFLVIENCQSQTISDSSLLGGVSSTRVVWKTPTQVRAALNLSNLYQPIGSYLTPSDTSTMLSAYRTAINGKQSSLVSNTNIKTINGASVLGSGDLVVNGTGLGYTLNVQALTSSPADGQTIYFGQLPKAPVTAAATSKVYIRKAGTIKIANIYSYSGTAGTNEAWVMYIRLNNTTDTQIASVSLSTNERVWSNTNLNIPVVAGDYIEIKLVNPVFATNPLTAIFGGFIYIE